MTDCAVTISSRGAKRWRGGHPWIYRSDVDDAALPPDIVRVCDERGRFLGCALWSPSSEIRLRFLTGADVSIDRSWWESAIQRAADRRYNLGIDATAYRVVHGEADGLPSLVVDRYGEYVVAQFLSAGLEAHRGNVLAALEAVLQPRGVLLRNDASVRRHEALSLDVEEVVGTVPDSVEVREGSVRYRVNLREGQKTGAFLDQRENRHLMAEVARGRALDLFTYQGLFALHMAHRTEHVLAVDSSGPALQMARENAALNGRTNVEWLEGNVFDLVRELERTDERFDTIVLDPRPLPNSGAP